jgi:hypothetical protein
MPDPDLSLTAASAQLSRKCAACEAEENAKILQTKPAGPAKAAAGEAPPIVHEVLRSPGQPLDQSTRAFFEPRFGHDFSRVRLHTDVKAAQAAQAIGALAYTVGSHIVFGETSQPRTPSGNDLLAHELTHVIQQGDLAATGRALPFGTSCQAAGPQVQRQQSDDGTVQSDDSDVQSDGGSKCKNCFPGGQLYVCCLSLDAANAPNSDECYQRYLSNRDFYSICNRYGPKYCSCTGTV